jgi:hypothetical protein
MKIAILFSGRIAKFDVHYENIINNIVQSHDADFFLSRAPDLPNETDEQVEEFKELYCPKAVQNTAHTFSTDYSGLVLHPQTNMHNFMSMWFNRRRVFQMMMDYANETNTIYDMVISLRLDSLNEEPLDYGRMVLAENTVYVPENYDWGGLNDQMAIGNVSSMAIYMMLFDDIWNLMRRQPAFGPETILLAHLLNNSIHISRFPFQYKLKNGKLWT